MNHRSKNFVHNYSLVGETGHHMVQAPDFVAEGNLSPGGEVICSGLVARPFPTESSRKAEVFPLLRSHLDI